MNTEHLVHGPAKGPQQGNQAFRDKGTSEVVHFSCPHCSYHLGFWSTQLHTQLLSIPGMVAEGSPDWVLRRSLSQLAENVGDILPIEQQIWSGLAK